MRRTSEGMSQQEYDAAAAREREMSVQEWERAALRLGIAGGVFFGTAIAAAVGVAIAVPTGQWWTVPVAMAMGAAFGVVVGRASLF